MPQLEQVFPLIVSHQMLSGIKFPYVYRGTSSKILKPMSFQLTVPIMNLIKNAFCSCHFIACFKVSIRPEGLPLREQHVTAVADHHNRGASGINPRSGVQVKHPSPSSITTFSRTSYQKGTSRLFQCRNVLQHVRSPQPLSGISAWGSALRVADSSRKRR